MTAPSFDPILEIDRLRIETVNNGTVGTLVDDVSFELETGGALAIVGESGSGKSMTAKALVSLLPAGVRASGGVRFQGKLYSGELDGLSELRGDRIVYLPQDPFTMLSPLRRCGRQIEDSIRGAERRGATARRSVQECLEEVGISDPAVADAYPYELSGGMQQRVGIAAALACDPVLLIADEPSTALDVTTQRQILDLLAELRAERNMSLILITHDLRVGFEVCQRACVLYAGSVIEVSPAEELYASPAHPYSLGLLLAEPSTSRRVALKPIEGRVPKPDDMAGKCCFVTRCEWRDESCDARKPDLRVIAEGRATRCGRANEIWEEMQDRLEVFRSSANTSDGVSSRTRDPILQIQAIKKTFTGTKRGTVAAVDDLTLEVNKGECVGLVGESGSGKTTLIRCAVGLEQIDVGNIKVGSILLNAESRLSYQARRELARTVQIVYQNPFASLNPSMTVGQTLQEATKLTRGQALDEDQIRHLLERVGLSGTYASSRPRELSGGERQRVAIARALAPEPRLLVLDEPVSALDVSVQAQILELLNGLRLEMNLSFLFVTHDLAVVRQVSDRIYVMKSGRIVESGTSRDVLDDPEHAYTKNLLAATPTEIGRQEASGASG